VNRIRPTAGILLVVAAVGALVLGKRQP